MQELNHTNGKGDKDRSPGWRTNYDAIDFHHGAPGQATGFARRGNRLVKTYTPGRQAFFVVDMQETCNGRCEHLGSPCCNYNTDVDMSCSLPRGHGGDHIACGLTGHDLAHWPRNLKEEAAFLSADLLAKGVKL